MVVNQNIVCIDCETGGFSPQKNPLTQISFIAIDSVNLQELVRFDTLIKPYDESLYITKEASELTGITLDMCKSKGRDLKEVLEEMNGIFKSLKVSYYIPHLLGHNLNFDLMYLTNGYDRVYGPNSGKCGVNKLFDFVLSAVEDTMLLARKKFVNNEVADFKLNTLAAYIGYENTHAHNALADVETTIEVYKYLIGSLRSDGKNNYQAAQKKDFKFQF